MKNKDVAQGAIEERSRFWKKLKTFLGCMLLSSKEEATSNKSKDGEGKNVRRDLVRHKRENPSSTNEGQEFIATCSNLRRFTFHDIQIATQNFGCRNFLGRGGFGTVFKGWVDERGNSAATPGTRVPVAVKTLNPNGFQGGTVRLPWRIRIKIAMDTANGLTFLHEEAARAIKNVFDTGHLTSKSDVYSFGMVLLEMLTGRRAVDQMRPAKEKHLVDWLRPRIRRKENFHYVMDPRFEGQYPIKDAYRAMRLAVQCLRHDPSGRPLMSEVVGELKHLLARDDDGMHSAPSISPSPSPSPSIPSSSLGRIHVGPSNHAAGANKYGLRTASEPNVPRRFQASPLGQDSPLFPPPS
ncbi:serine/threonine-protein kinase [Vigna angularis]|uniref:Serine/threonine-protein kinase n=1 Tax=Phaseolus angularis TaxID=3914 RepID=A0A8T0JTJ5_PHAAN|nr:serine/threonine-protein kinase [Vigna angularis]